MFERKVHYKMYKAGKNWVFAAIATIAVSMSFATGDVKADQTTTVDANQTTTVDKSTTSQDTATTVESSSSENESTVDNTSDATNSPTTDSAVTTDVTTATKDTTVVDTSKASQEVETTKATTADTSSSTNETTSAETSSSEATTNSATADLKTDTATVDSQTDTTATSKEVATTPEYTQVNQDGNWYLVDATGNYLSGFQTITDQNKTVYYDPTTYQMQYGQQKINGSWYLFDTFNGAMQTGVQYIRTQNKLVYYNEQGQMQHGQVNIDNKVYQTNPVTGAIEAKGQQKIANNWYLFNQQQQIVTGFQTIAEQNKVVYYDPTTAKMQYGQQKINGSWYYFDTFDGAMKTGFVEIPEQNKTVYYATDGKMQYGQQKIDGNWYNFDTFDGAMKTGFVEIPEQNKTVYYAADGKMQYGQQKIDDNWYYFDTFDGAMKTSFVEIPEQDKTVYYNEKGQMQYGWQMIDGNVYYFDTYDGKMSVGQQKIGDYWYLFDANGVMQTGINYIPDQNKLVYYNEDGQMQYGQQTIDGTTYDFNTFDGALENLDGQQKIAGNWYLFTDGQVMTGFQYISDQNKTVYYSPTTAQMQYGWQDIDGSKYYFDTFDGAMYTGSHLIDGTSYTFGTSGALLDLSLQDYRQEVADGIAAAIQDKYRQTIDANWDNQNDNYLAFSVHDVAQLVARNNLTATAEAVEKNLKTNALFEGTADTIWVKSYDSSDMKAAVTQAINDFMASYTPRADLSKTALGVGAKNMDGTLNVAIIVFTLGENSTTEQTKATSSLTAKVSETYLAPGVNATAIDGLTSGSVISADELGSTFTVDTSLLDGVKGEKIGEQNLKMIFSSLPGNESGLEGQKVYKGTDGNDYHYVFWLSDTFDGDQVGKQEAFLAANKDAVYGDVLTVTYSATLTWGAPVAPSTGVNGVPTSQMTDEEIDLAYKTGTDTGLRYDSVKVEPIEGMTDDMIRGVDIGSYQSLINAGVKFYDFDGNEAPIYKVLKDAGVNWIRLRIWNDPYDANNNTYAGGDCSEENVMKMATDASKYGLKVLLDFHYSDFWADPAKQPLPKAWEDESGEALAKSVYNYTSKILTDLKNAGVDIGMVQIGNEITNGVFGIYSNRDRGESYYNIWGNETKASEICQYLNAGSSAVRKVLPDAKIAIQLETPNVPKYRNIMTALRDNNVDYDLLGTSYYPFWSTNDGNGWYDDVDMGWGANTPKSLEGVEKMAKEEFGKQVVVLETGWINNVRDSDGTGNSIGADSEIQAYSHDPQGQVDAMADMYKALIAQGGLGGFWWEPAWIPVKAGWENWQYNKDASDKYGTGWASQYAVGYAPDSVMYYNGEPTWGGSTWDNVALFDDQGHPLQSLKMYNGFLNGYETPQNLTSTLAFKITKVWNSDNVALQNGLAEGDLVSASDMIDPLTSDATALLSGAADTTMSQSTLEAIAKGMGGIETALEGKTTYYTENGDAYHYVYWFTEGNTADQKAWNFYNDNQTAKYGDKLIANVEATVTWGAAQA
ncbi:glycosyl hydrolase 53 protein [Ligilactobacillus apodemi DSM 16634 = JCM 16172]|uniref:Arabinogalactan endo-beta-1,4-galactanase n=3 Tax=Ligilactobacillus TaxID=2767887 RepID=A0A0R1U2J6_9LACO|nr:glycosyl hydrolase 53 family protein [Ligilactobacillus apodemi]KRL87166.1 glycosyl hydrolase 53 protein [Ligilactobacillus apodemi DSM 16634 = JCM 16172]